MSPQAAALRVLATPEGLARLGAALRRAAVIDQPALFALTVLLLNATPGVDMALMTASTLQQGARAGLATALGISGGCVLHTLAAACGLAALLAASSEAFTLIKLCGAAYLLWLAVGMLRQGLKPDAAKTASPARGFGALVWQGFWTNALNPKIALFFLALLPPFIAADAPSKPLAFLLLGAWFIVQGGLFSLVFVSLVAQARKLPKRPGVARGLNLAGAGLFTFLAARLALAKNIMNKLLVIGASRGIGLEWVRQARAAGEQVTATARDEDGLARLRALGAKAIRLDLLDAASCAGLAWLLDGEQFDAAVINAGVYGPDSAAPTVPTQDEFDTVMRTNVLGPMRVLSTLGDALGQGAKLAIISSRMGSIGLRSNPSGWLYRASKTAVNSVLKDASLHLGGRVSCVAFHPGWVRTDMGGPQADLAPEDAVAQLRATLARVGATDNGSFLNFDGTPLAW